MFLYREKAGFTEISGRIKNLSELFQTSSLGMYYFFGYLNDTPEGMNQWKFLKTKQKRLPMKEAPQTQNSI